MVSVVSNTYKMQNTSEENLKKLGFRYSGDSNYIYRFSVYKYENKSLLDCELIVDIDTKLVSIDVYQHTGKIYSQFYCNEYSNNEIILVDVNNRILNEFKKLKIKPIKNKKTGDED